MSKLLFLFLFIITLQNVSSQWLRYGAPRCIDQCFEKKSDAFYCTHGREFGWCCGDNSRSECQEDPNNEVYCSQNADTHPIMKYSYCIRKTDICSTKSVTLIPLLNQEQPLTLNNTMLQSRGDVCWYELYVNSTLFNITHPNVNQTEVYITIHIIYKQNMKIMMTQGTNRKSAHNATIDPQIDSIIKFPLSSGSSVFLIAYPNDQTNDNYNIMNLTFSITTPYYLPSGQDRKIRQQELPDFDAHKFWNFLYIGVALGLIIAITLFLCVCCRTVDPRTQFETRRRAQTKQKIKQEKEKAKQEKKKSKSNKNKKAKKDSDDEEDDEKPKKDKKKEKEKEKPKPKKKAKDSDDDEEEEEVQKKSVKKDNGKKRKEFQVKQSLETESKQKKEKGMHNDFNLPLLDNEEDD